MRKIKLFKPYVSWWAVWYTIKVLRSGQLAEGPQVKLFEREFMAKFGVKNALALNSGTAALELAYELAGIKEEDEVITPILTCTATNLPLVRRGAKIIFADIAEDLNVDIEDIKKKITAKTKAIVFVHFGGNNRGLKELLALAKERNIILIEDAAQAVGSDFWGQADFAAVSLQAIKTLTSGDGGFLICKDSELYSKAKRLRWFGYDRDKKQAMGDMDLLEAGYKYHMNDISAAIGRGNLKVIDKIIEHRKALGKIYAGYGLAPSIWMTFGFTEDYPALKEVCAKQGIEIGQHHYRNDQYTIFGGRRKLAKMDAIENKYFFVPMHPAVTVRQAHKIGKIYEAFRSGETKKER